ncbi:uncharacterized protein LOC128388471 isoform X2 [Panonychus citri]|uniref:uncharacterized protein LOC128388471 isoform X2 n=1 Tax=Panonychus citri TaxID=50023 RepID=UPI00230780A6|nr:uncharacterized protein LOC128388471 isoform X2 [Panonychus citri]
MINLILLKLSSLIKLLILLQLNIYKHFINCSPDILEITVPVNGAVKIPCNVSLSGKDEVLVILWYQNGNATGPPFYSLDFRESRPQHFLQTQFKNRITLGSTFDPPFLLINPVNPSDDGYFSCRADYKWARTKTQTIKINVIVPPKGMFIKDRLDQPVYAIAGPYPQDEPMELTCIAENGKPPPRILWYLNDTLVDETYEIMDTPSTNLSSTSSSSASQATINSHVINRLSISKLDRSYYQSVLTCQAINNYHPSVPVSISIRLDMYLKPVDVLIKPNDEPFVAGKKVEVVCSTFGSKPPAKVNWFLRNRELKRTRLIHSPDGNSSTSTLIFAPSADDDGSILICQAQNPNIKNYFMEDKLPLKVLYMPQPPKDCSLTNDTSNSILITCFNPDPSKSLSTNSPEVYCLEVYDISTSSLILFMEDRSPRFKVSLPNLKDIHEYSLTIYAKNSFSRSASVNITVKSETSLLLNQVANSSHSDVPQPPKDCSLTNDTSNSILITCFNPDPSKSLSTNSPEVYCLEVYDISTSSLILFMEDRSPRFKVSLPNLKDIHEYSLTIYAKNSFSRSASVNITVKSETSLLLNQVANSSHSDEMYQDNFPYITCWLLVLSGLSIVVLLFIVKVKRCQLQESDVQSSDGKKSTNETDSSIVPPETLSTPDSCQMKDILTKEAKRLTTINLKEQSKSTAPDIIELSCDSLVVNHNDGQEKKTSIGDISEFIIIDEDSYPVHLILSEEDDIDKHQRVFCLSTLV